MGIKKVQRGFTLMEIVVATTIFAFVVTALMSLFNYTLKINRKSEALRQATQGIRNFTEFITKQIRNGDIDYGIIGGNFKTGNYPLGPCDVGAVGDDTYGSNSSWLGIITEEGEEACIYFADYQGNAIAGPTCTAPTTQNCTMVMEKPGGVKEIITQSNFRIDELSFFVRPGCDPFSTTCNGGLPEEQPSVTIALKFMVRLTTGEVVTLYYQTGITSSLTDIPSS
jgi:prepilin-type N-terminal cleavage/methylation domain-containing protein